MLLGIDTATREGSVAAWVSEEEHTSVPLGDRNHASTLAPTVAGFIERFGPPVGYAVDIGPGSFTGLRVGLAFLKGLARAYPGPVVAAGSLEILAAELFSQRTDELADVIALCVLRANGPYVFAGAFRSREGEVDGLPALPVGLYLAESLAGRIIEAVDPACPIVAAGDGLSQIELRPGWIRSSLRVPQASMLLRMARPRLERGEGASAAHLEPSYHQASAAEDKLKKVNSS